MMYTVAIMSLAVLSGLIVWVMDVPEEKQVQAALGVAAAGGMAALVGGMLWLLILASLENSPQGKAAREVMLTLAILGVLPVHVAKVLYWLEKGIKRFSNKKQEVGDGDEAQRSMD